MNVTTLETSKISISKLISGSFLIAGTMIGAGMLGIPMSTAASGFIPACMTTFAVWFFMLVTGFLLLEVSLHMPKGSNFLSISEHFLGKAGKYFIGAMFMFLYYCLIIAYIAGGAPLFGELIGKGMHLSSFSYLIFSAIFGLVVYLGTKWVDRVNIVLTFIMFGLFFLLVITGFNFVNPTNLAHHNFSKMFLSVPVLFGAFGYHNVIPTLCDYLERDRKVLSLSLVFGTLISLSIYIIWQQTVLGAVSIEALQTAMDEGKTCVAALQEIASSSSLYRYGKYFAAAALSTSLLGVSLSVVDFLHDGFTQKQINVQRGLLCFLVFAPCAAFAIFNPTIFSKALGLAGGVGEAILNGIFPISLVWVGFHYMKLPSERMKYYYGKRYLTFLLLLGLLTVGIEIYDLL